MKRSKYCYSCRMKRNPARRLDSKKEEMILRKHGFK